MPSTMHPRRRPARPNDTSSTPSLIDSFQNMNIRKGDTFHNINQKQDIWDPLESSMPKAARSTTCPKSLEDLLIGAGERRAAELLQRVDKAIATNSKLALGAVLSEPEVLPVPTFMVSSIQEDGAAAQKVRPEIRRHSHSSDSGIGSSVADSDCASLKSTDEGSTYTLTTSDESTGLSEYAARQIHKHIVKPILDEKALKEFHPLVEKVPARIGNKDIKTLRELERTLIFLAPEYTRSPNKYLRFCERTIRVLHTTVTTLHDSDQRAPSDRPYTQGYFFDLVEQIRRYAQILAATREAQEKGESSDVMQDIKNQSVSLHGGVTHNGKPAELVRHTADGKAISLATGQVISPEELASAGTMKRPFADDGELDEDALRSMARRKKGAKPETHYCHVDGCDKEFKRPCDLTKHVKTHERPFKCPVKDCKFHDQGWPTEKECERHYSDKHSTAPPLYHCLFDGCPYNSKRESNCKQHMEKAHGWEYVRSKSNGKGKSSKSVTHISRGSIPPSPASYTLTPQLTPIAPSPSVQSWTSSRGSMPPPPLGVAGPSNYNTPAFTHPSPDFGGHFNFNFNDMSSAFPTPAMSDDRRASTSGSSHSGLQLDGSSGYEESPHELNWDNFDFGDFNNFQQPSPYSAGGASAEMGFDSTIQTSAPHTSPGAQLDQTFTADANYGGAMDVDGGFGNDFTLFGASAPAAAPATTGDMFPSLPAEGSSWGNFGGQFSQPTFTTGTSALDELFPELKGH